MTASTILRRGIIPVPLYLTPYSPLATDFNANSMRGNSPYFSMGGMFVGTSTVVTNHSAVAGPADFLSTIDVSGTGGNQIFPIYMKGYSWAYTGLYPGNGMWIAPQPNVSGSWNGLNSTAHFVPDTFFGTAAFMGPPSPAFGMPFLDYLSSNAGGWMPGICPMGSLNSPLGPWNATGRYWNPQTSAMTQEAMFQWPSIYSYPDIANSGNYLQCPSRFSGIVPGLFDAPPGATVPRQAIFYEPTAFVSPFAAPPPLSTFEPVFDDSLLQSIWNGAGGSGTEYGIDVSPAGWLFRFKTNGTGPTGQLWEIALVDPFFTTYNLLQLIAQEATGVQALKQSGRPGQGWLSKVDDNGVFYFNNGYGPNSQSIWYSYSPIPWPYPSFTYTPGAFQLPCFNTCFPMPINA